MDGKKEVGCGYEKTFVFIIFLIITILSDNFYFYRKGRGDSLMDL